MLKDVMNCDMHVIANYSREFRRPALTLVMCNSPLKMVMMFLKKYIYIWRYLTHFNSGFLLDWSSFYSISSIIAERDLEFQSQSCADLCI